MADSHSKADSFLKYRELLNLPARRNPGTWALRTAALTPVADAFSHNYSRVFFLAVYSPGLIKSAFRWDRLNAKAAHEVLGSPDLPTEDQVHQFGQQLTDAVARHSAARELLEVSNPEVRQQATDEALSFLSVMLESDATGVLSRGLGALFSSMLVGAWTAFETLAGDLWITAVNTHPAKLADLTGSPKRIQQQVGGRHQKGNLDGPTGDQSDRKIIELQDIHILTRGTYDIRQCMGDLLRRRFKFTTLRGIREAYSVAFSEKVKSARTAAIDGALAHKALDALAAVRNLIVHKASIVDAEYVEAAKTASTAPQLSLGEHLKLDGEVVCGLIGPVVGCCHDLITVVDQWLALTSG